MRRILVNMQNCLFGDLVSEVLRQGGNGMEVMKADSPEDVLEICKWYMPYAILLEVSAYTPWNLKERLWLRHQVKKLQPECKIILIVDENTEKELAREVGQAKKDDLIDQFIYGSISATYLRALMDTL